MVEAAPNPHPRWWRGISTPPPAAWAYMFEEFTGDDSVDEWALAAAIAIVNVHQRGSQGPTFRELFTRLLPDTNGLPGPFPHPMSYYDRRRVISRFRIYTALQWRRRGMIDWEIGVPRSLRVGRAFRELSRERRKLGARVANE